MPMKKAVGENDSTIMDIEKYGGYNKPASAFFVIARYMRGKKKEVSFVPISLMDSKRFLSDPAFAIEYATKVLQSINTKTVTDVEFPLGKRVIKYKTVLSLDGFRVWINGKANGGKIVLLTSAESLILPREEVNYIKRLENYYEKRKNNKTFLHDELFDGLSERNNIVLYERLTDKLMTSHFKKMPGNQGSTLTDGKSTFINLSFDDQIAALINVISLLKSGRAGGCDLTKVKGKSSSGAMTLGANLSSSSYSEICIIDTSSAGLHENKSINLLDLLK